MIFSVTYFVINIEYHILDFKQNNEIKIGEINGRSI